MNAMIEVKESDNGGKIVTAVRDIPFGASLLQEMPLFIVSKEVENCETNVTLETKTGIPRLIWGLYNAFKLLKTVDQEKYLSLYTEFDSVSELLKDHLSKPEYHIPDLDIEEFIAVNKSLRDQGGFCGDNTKGVYLMGSRCSHSCRPNCSWISDNTMLATLRTIRDVKCGEELTTCTEEDFFLNPIVQRRSHYLKVKNFLCQCERCSAFGDDTRRFTCYSMAAKSSTRCTGHHCVCQPTQDDKPYLLPCSVCLIVPGSAWEESMLALEQQELAKIQWTNTSRGFLYNLNVCRRLNLYSGTITLPLPLPLHYSAVYFLEMKFYAASMEQDVLTMVRCARDLLTLYDQLMVEPHQNHYLALTYVGAALFRLTNSTEAWQVSLRALRQAFRLYFACNGIRDTAMARMILDILIKQRGSGESELDLTLCALCHSSHASNATAAALSKCGRCLSVVYCGRECQVTHWKLHKELCGSITSTNCNVERTTKSDSSLNRRNTD